MMFYRGKRARKRTLARPVLLALSLVLVLGLSVGGTLAFLIADTDPVINTFTPGEVKTEIKEEFANDIKENVYVTNTGTVDAYIRAQIVINWVDGEGNIVADPGEVADYELLMGSSKWKKGADGFWYYTEKVKAGGKTENLINRCEVTTKADAGVGLQVTILSQAIQAEPVDAIKDAEWPVTIDPVSGDLRVNS